MAVLGLHCCANFSPVLASRGYSNKQILGFPVQGLLIAVTSLIVEHRFYGLQ